MEPSTTPPNPVSTGQAAPTPTPAPVPAEELDPRTRAQVKKELHEKRNKERADAAAALKGSYQSLKTEPAMVDVLEKARAFAAYHLKLAKDGVGGKIVGYDDNNQPQVEDITLSSEQRISELDQCKGLEQLISYIEQKIN